VREFSQDLEAYRRLLLAPDEGGAKAAKRAESRKRPSREAILALRAEARKSEARLEKLAEMRDKLATRLADPALYQEGKLGEMEVWQKKYAEVMEAIDRAEALWLKAQEKLEKAEACP